ncbi:hypothetical protein [Asticcacaulis sp. YBE204]|uniref:hypothetical protein n=1 Tax=Asticcacaulis sp. YBE204 TaxID=1282363 RepID=UPI0003C3D160|nr:hypothetical protein [Asticcacaulis sp. YBE204]ESQ79346.1 hypothetical protein AEYBE204_10075 [Asticcacaulis sp. YBE204]
MKTIWAIFTALCAFMAPVAARAQSGTEFYGRIWFFNYTDKPAHLTFADGRAAIDVPARLVVYIPVNPGGFDFTVELESFRPLKESHYFEKSSSFAEVDGKQWVCMMLSVPNGEYYHPDLVRMLSPECGELIESGKR